MTLALRSLAFMVVWSSLSGLAAAQTYCPISLMGQYGGTYYYSCQVCDAGKPDNCTSQSVALNKPVNCNGPCACCGGSCEGIRNANTKKFAPTPDDPSGVDTSNDADYADAKDDDFLLPASHLSKRPFYVSYQDTASTMHYFKCFLVINPNSAHALCIGREQSTVPTGAQPVTLDKKLDSNHFRGVVVPDSAGHPNHKPYCYFTTMKALP